MALRVALCLSVCLCLQGWLLKGTRAPTSPSHPMKRDHQGAGDLGWLPSASPFMEVTEMWPTGCRLAPGRVRTPGPDSALLSPSCPLLVSKPRKPFSPGSSPGSSPIDTRCLYNALPRAALPASVPSLEVPCDLASLCTQASPGKGL